MEGVQYDCFKYLTLSIKKETLYFSTKNRCLIFQERLSVTIADNQLTLDWAIMIYLLMAGYEIDFSHMINFDMHNRCFGRLPYLHSLV